MSKHSFQIIQGGRSTATARPQAQQSAPLKPTREQILDLILEGDWTFQEIAVKTRTSLGTVYRVNATYHEQHHRQAVAGRLQAEAWLLERYHQIEQECWSEYGIRGRAA